MSLFSSLFGKKKSLNIHNKVWMQEATKDKKLAEYLSSTTGKVLLISFFEETAKKMEALCAGKPGIKCMKASDILLHRKDTELKIWFSQSEKELLFSEHYPLRNEEEEVLQYIAGLSGEPVSAVFFTSLEDPLIAAVSGQSIKSMMEKLGMGPEEMLQHSLIDSSIKRAQEKLQEKTQQPIRANSAKEWFRLNVKTF